MVEAESKALGRPLARAEQGKCSGGLLLCTPAAFPDFDFCGDYIRRAAGSAGCRQRMAGGNACERNARGTLMSSATLDHAEERLKDLVKTYLESQPKLAAWAEENLPEGIEPQ
jgi:hypothetical protein